MRIRANTILRVCFSSLDAISLLRSEPVFINLVHTNPFGALLPSWLCVHAKIHFSCIHRLFACIYYMHASVYMQLCRTNLEQKSDLQCTPPKNTNTKNRPKKNLHPVRGTTSISPMCYRAIDSPHLAWLQATALLQASNCCYFTSLR